MTKVRPNYAINFFLKKTSSMVLRSTTTKPLTVQTARVLAGNLKKKKMNNPRSADGNLVSFSLKKKRK